MKVSVVVPVYNEEAYISNCVESLDALEEKPHEIIIVDNNSTDSSIDIVKGYDVRIIREKRQGITYARNRGYDSATGDIIARCDADVIVESDWIKKIKKNFTRYKIDALSGPVVFYDFPLRTPAYAKAYFELLKNLQNGKETLIGPNTALSKKMWARVRGQLCTDDKKVHEDQDLAIHISQMGGKIRIDQGLVNHASARRLLHNPKSFFLEYPARLVRTHTEHHP